MTPEQKLEKWAQKEFARHGNLMILEDGKGNYMAFNKFILTPISDGIEVRDLSDTVDIFSNLPTAMSYCVANNFRQYNLARRIRLLDQQRRMLTNDLRIRRSQAERSTKPAFREMVQTKIDQKNRYCRSVIAELNKCLDRAKYLQLRGFINETARTSRT